MDQRQGCGHIILELFLDCVQSWEKPTDGDGIDGP